MSNHLAVATVSASLRSLVETAAKAALPGVDITVETGRPDRLIPPEDKASVSVFLYQVAPNPQWRNEDLPTRRANGSLVQRPQAALDLFYLLTFFGVENKQHAERMMGGVVGKLHAAPSLGRKFIEDVISADTHLVDSDLARQPERVRFTPLALSLEELSKLWSVFSQTDYRPSVAYKVSVVLISPEDEMPQPTLPVAARNVYVETLEPPFIDSARVGDDPTTPVVIGDELILRGRNLNGEAGRIAIGEAEAAPHFTGSRELRVHLTEGPFAAGSLRAGPVGVRVIHSRMMGTPETAHVGPRSNLLAVGIHPRIHTLPLSSTQAVADYKLKVVPTVGTRQDAFLLLNNTSEVHTIPAKPRTADTEELEFDITGVSVGTYLIRVQIDGAESMLVRHDTDSDGEPDLYTEPTLTVDP